MSWLLQKKLLSGPVLFIRRTRAPIQFKKPMSCCGHKPRHPSPTTASVCFQQAGVNCQNY
jgi:hypothetical protein